MLLFSSLLPVQLLYDELPPFFVTKFYTLVCRLWRQRNFYFGDFQIGRFYSPAITLDPIRSLTFYSFKHNMSNVSYLKVEQLFCHLMVCVQLTMHSADSETCSTAPKRVALYIWKDLLLSSHLMDCERLLEGAELSAMRNWPLSLWAASR